MSEYKFAYDPVLKRPGCVLLQAAMGCEYSQMDRFFDSQDWLLAPTPDMKVFSGDGALWTKVGVITFVQRKIRLAQKDNPK